MGNRTDRRDAYEEIAQERLAQDAEWGGPGHDDEHEPLDWIDFINKHAGRAVAALATADTLAVKIGECDPLHVETLADLYTQRDAANDEYRRRLVIIGALAVAGIQSFDRKERAS